MEPIATPELVFQPILPELLLVAFGLAGMLYEAFAARPDRRVHQAIAVAGLAGAGAASIWMWGWSGARFVLGNTVAADRFSVVARLVLVAAALVGCLLYTSQATRLGRSFRGEFYPLIVFATSGMTLITAANDLIVVFLALEVLSLCLYVLTAIGGRERSVEASVKYFLLGATSSAFFLFGVAMAYGATASTRIDHIAGALGGRLGSQGLALLALGLVAVGFGFKVSAAPFHMWTPDVYQGAPTPVTAFMSAVTKVAAFFALIRIFDVAMQPLALEGVPIVYGLALVSVVVGSVLAIAQSDLKRMLAYSSVAHAGFILTGLTAAGVTGIRPAIFYLIAYAAMTLGSFGVIVLLEGGGDALATLESVTGLSRRRPVLAALMTVFLLSLAGIPPTAGFIAKVGVFSAAIDAGNWPLVLAGVVASVAAAFFYLRVIVFMYMKDPEGEVSPEAMSPSVTGAVMVTLAAVTVVLGVFPGLLSGIIEEAAILRW